MNRFATYCALIVLGLALAAPLGAQTFACAPPDTLRQDLLDLISVVATDTALAADRDLFALALVSATDVEIVTDNTVCGQAGLAYARAMGDTLRSRLVYVIRAGSRYVVVDREEQAGEWVMAAIFDSSFGAPLKQIGV
jgi:hypothetical protein